VFNLRHEKFHRASMAQNFARYDENRSGNFHGARERAMKINVARALRTGHQNRAWSTARVS
jgi:hypothetical protein